VTFKPLIHVSLCRSGTSHPVMPNVGFGVDFEYKGRRGHKWTAAMVKSATPANRLG
jgi:hypothetical protein